MNTQFVMLTIGISASGKTTEVKKLINSNKNNPRGFINVNRDDLRFSLFGASSWADYKFSKAKENFITECQFDVGLKAINSGKNLIVSDTNLSERTRTKWKLFCEEHKVEYREWIIDTPVEECQKRNALRANGIPPNVIYEQHKKFQDQFGKKYTPDTSLPEAIIVDIDGTLAHMDGKRKPFDWKLVGGDSPDWNILDTVDAHYSNGKKVIILSGRDSVCRAETEKWLHNHGVAYHELFMRSEGDNRKDTEIKKELFDNHIKYNYNVTLCIDDRPCMVDMWNDLGIKTWACADQRLRF